MNCQKWGQTTVKIHRNGFVHIRLKVYIHLAVSDSWIFLPNLLVQEVNLKNKIFSFE